MTPNRNLNHPVSFLTSNFLYGLHPLHRNLEGILSLALQSSKRRPRRRLLDLPLELIVAILTELDWREVLNIRQTSAALHRASKERPIWLNLFNQLVLHVLVDFKLDYPIELYTSQELEGYTLRFISSDMVWSTDRMKPSVILQQIPCPGDGYFYLSESGRWLLVLTATGHVDYYDLDNPRTPKRLLIPGMQVTSREAFMVVDIDSDEANLTFNLALFVGYSFYCTSSFHIWRVELIIDSLDKQPYLTAKKIASFPQDTPGFFCDMSLLGDIFAYSVSYSDGDGPAFVVLVEWRVISTNADLQMTKFDYPKRIIYPKEGSYHPHVRLLPDHRLFVLSQNAAQLFYYNEIQFSNKFIWGEIRSDRYTPCHWRQLNERDCYPETLSSAFISQSSKTIKLVVAGWDIIFGFVIPLYRDFAEDGHTGPRRVTLIHPFDKGAVRDRGSFGCRKGLARSTSTGVLTALAISYSWPDGLGPAEGKFLEKNVIGPPAVAWPSCHTVFNEFTGRVLVSAEDIDLVVLFDLALST